MSLKKMLLQHIVGRRGSQQFDLSQANHEYGGDEWTIN
jgi:hypothetical protein